MSLRTPFRLALASAAWLVLPVAGAAQQASPLESLRLLPPVLLKGEEGWSLAERMHGEAASPPRIEQIDPLLAQQPFAAEKSQPLVAEDGRPPWGARQTAERCGGAGRAAVTASLGAAAPPREPLVAGERLA